MKNVRVGIIGAGPAGIAAAIQLKRYGFEPTVFERDEIGGLLRNANLVENYLGFPDGITGPELIETFKSQLEKFSIDFKPEDVINLNYGQDGYSLTTMNGTYQFDYIIAASGTKHREFDNSVVHSDFNGRVIYEIYLIKYVRNKDIAIIGAGDAAFDYAINLARLNSVTIYNKGSQIKCLPLLKTRTDKSDNIKYRENCILTNIKSTSNSHLSLTFSHVDEFVNQDVDYLVIAIGREPNISYLSNELIQNLDKLMAEELIYFIGDVKNKLYRQTSIASGDGIKAAMMIYSKVRENQ